jgi:gliding motility-associated-like protein
MQVAIFPACQQMARIEVQQSQAQGYRLNQGAVQLDSVFSGLIPGTYFLEILLPQNCRLDTTIIIPAAPSLGDTILAVRAITCDTLGACFVQPVGGTSPFLYQLNPGFWQNTGYFQDLAAGSYTLQVQDALGCIATDTFSILPHIPLNGQIDQLIGDQCNRADGAIELSVYGGTPPYVYQLNGAAAQSAPVFEGLSAGLYTLEVIDAADCRHFLTVQVPTLGDTAYTQEVVQLFEGDSYVLPDGRRIFKPGTFVFQNQTILGCDSTHVIILQIFPRNVYIPNVFYPSSGGENAFFTIFSDASLEAISRLSIYDRWGELLFDAREMAPNQESMGWDGTFRGKSMETGVYVWFATVRFVDGVVWTLKGDLTLFR